MNRRKGPTPPEEDRDDERSLFRRAVSDARPLVRDFVQVARPRPAPRARFRRRDERAALEESLDAGADDLEPHSGERVVFGRPGVGRRTLRKLARGNYSVQGHLDLHGMTLAEADAALAGFIDETLALGHRCVRIVHGKGLNSGSAGPVLKPHVHRRLRHSSSVLAFASARQVDGGSGAVYVLFR